MEEQTSSGADVLNKAALVLGTLETGPATLAQLVSSTGLVHPITHRLAVTLEYHRMVARDIRGRFILSPRLQELSSAANEDRLPQASMPVLQALRNHTRESSQFFHRQGDYHVCVAASEHEMGLCDSIPVGTTLSMSAGSAAQVPLAWEEPDRLHRDLYGASFNTTMPSEVRHRGWAQSMGEREPDVVSVSAPVRSPSGRVPATLSISGPIERIGRQPGHQRGPSVTAAVNRLTGFLSTVENAADL